MQRSTSAVFATIVFLSLGCNDPLREGCRYAAGLDASCKPSDGKWCNTKGELGCSGLPVAAVAVPAGSESTKTDDEIRQVDKAIALSAAPKSDAEVDFIEQLMIRRLIFMYPSRGTLNDCIKTDKREDALKVILSRDASGYKYINRGPASSVKSSQFETEYVSAKLRAAVDARLKEEVSDPVKLKATADVVLGILTKNVRSDFTAGQYRSLSLISHQQLWEELTCKGLVRNDCSAEKALTSLGVSVAILASKDSLVDSSIGMNFETKVAAELGITPEQAARIKLAVQAELAISIQTTSQKSLSVSLSTPALVPLAWKADTLLQVDGSGCEPKKQSCREREAERTASQAALADFCEGKFGGEIAFRTCPSSDSEGQYVGLGTDDTSLAIRPTRVKWEARRGVYNNLSGYWFHHDYRAWAASGATESSPVGLYWCLDKACIGTNWRPEDHELFQPVCANGATKLKFAYGESYLVLGDSRASIIGSKTGATELFPEFF